MNSDTIFSIGTLLILGVMTGLATHQFSTDLQRREPVRVLFGRATLFVAAFATLVAFWAYKFA